MRPYALLVAAIILLAGCAADRPAARPTPQPGPLAAERRELRFPAADGTALAGELSLPRGVARPPLVVIIHHSGPVGRDAYGYLADLLLPRGYAVFRFDKRGTGASAGAYGCCEAADALAAYAAASAQPDIDPQRFFIVAQSIGTQHLAGQFPAFAAAAQPCGVALLSSLLGPEAIAAVAAPVTIIVADSEPALDRIGLRAAAAHHAAWPDLGAALYVAAQAEHTLFDISAGPIDWADPSWATRYHRGAMASLLGWLDAQRCEIGQ